MNILVTGGAGFVGSNLVETLAQRGESVVVVDDLSTGFESNISKSEKVKFLKGSTNDKLFIDDIFDTHKFDAVFHYAAVVGVQRTLNDPIAVLDDVEGFKIILEASARTGVKRLFYSSSSEVYGISKEFPQNEETTPLNARLPYAIVKSVGEAFFESYGKIHNMDFTIFRFFNTYGPRQNDNYVMSRFIYAALKNEDITVYGDGSQTRSFGYIGDNMDATMKALYEGCAVNDVINIGSDIELSVKELAEKIISITGSKSKIVHLPALEEGDMPRRKPDVTKYQSVLLDRDFTPLDEGILKTVDYIKTKI